jgi:hypothetical protein
VFLNYPLHYSTGKPKILSQVLRVCLQFLPLNIRTTSRLGYDYLPKRIFGPKRDEVTGGWRKLHDEELHDLYSSPSIIRIIKARRMRWVGYVELMWEKRKTYRLMVGKPEGNMPLGRPRCR